jgi:hypothetical protein
MRQKKWWVLLSVLSVLLTVCAVHSVRNIAASERRTQSGGNDIVARLEKGVEVIAEKIKSRRSASYPPCTLPDGYEKIVKVAKEGELGQQEAEQLRKLDYKLRDVDRYVAQERQAIQTWYAEQLAYLKRYAQSRRNELDAEEKAAKARHEQMLKNTVSTKDGRFITESYGHVDAHTNPYGHTTASGYVVTSGQYSETAREYVQGDPTGEYSATMQRIAQARNEIDQRFAILERKKADRFEGLDAEQRRKKTNIAWYKGRVQRETARKSSGFPDLRVEAIGSEGDNRSYVMANGALVHEGETVNGYKVLKIHADKVEFEKDGKGTVQGLE